MSYPAKKNIFKLEELKNRVRLPKNRNLVSEEYYFFMVNKKHKEKKVYIPIHISSACEKAYTISEVNEITLRKVAWGYHILTHTYTHRCELGRIGEIRSQATKVGWKCSRHFGKCDTHILLIRHFVGTFLENLVTVVHMFYPPDILFELIWTF